MITISFRERDTTIRIQNDKTFGDVLIMARDKDHEMELINELVPKLLKNED